MIFDRWGWKTWILLALIMVLCSGLVSYVLQGQGQKSLQDLRVKCEAQYGVGGYQIGSCGVLKFCCTKIVANQTVLIDYDKLPSAP